MPFIEARDVGYRYPTIQNSEPALAAVSFSVERGEYVAVLGSNGSGKTTLALLLDGLLQPTSGSIRIDGRDTRQESELAWIRRRVAIVFQRPEEQIVGVTIEEDTAFGPENVGMERAAMIEAVERALRRVRLWELRGRSPHELSAGQKQRLAIAGALALSPECLVLDEAASMLDPGGRKELQQVLEELNAEGVTIVEISHRMESAARADRVMVLHHGVLVADGTPAALFAGGPLADWGLRPPQALELSRMLTTRYGLRLSAHLSFDGLARELARMAPRRATLPSVESSASAFARQSQRPAARATDPAPNFARTVRLTHVYPGQRSPSLRDVSISVVSGEAVALVGATGSGKSTLLQHLCALYLPQSGVIELFGKRIGPDDGELARLRRRAALLFQRPEEQLFERYVGDEVAYGPRLAGVGGKALTERVRVAMESAGLSFTDFKDRLTFALSGGEQRKVGIADVLALEPVALLLDEPTAGLDPESREQTMRLVERLKAQGTTIVVATHDMNEVARIADRTVALVEGSVVFDGPTREFFERGLRLREMGLDVPDFVLPLIELANRGAAIPRVALSLEETCELLGRLFVETGHDRGRYAAV